MSRCPAVLTFASSLVGLAVGLLFIASGVAAAPKTGSTEAADPSCCEPSQAKTSRRNTTPSLIELSSTPWLEPSARSKSFPFNFQLTEQDGKALSRSDLEGKPIAISFIYTRCKNVNKCPLVADTLGKLQKELVRQGLNDQVHLVLMTYDPENDLPARMLQYGEAHGLVPGPGAHLVRPEPSQKEEFFKALDVAVNFKGYDVNIHGIQLLLFDKESRFVRSYHSVIWDNGVVAGDLGKLVKEERRAR